MESSEAITLESDQRVNPIHAQIPEVKLPSIASNNLQTSTTLHPVSLKPFTSDELRSHNIEALLRQYATPEAAAKARDDTAKDLRKLLDENEKKRRDIKREMDEKEKTREMERKVYARKLGKDG